MGRRARPEIRELVAEATRSLARLDAPRLKELALCCQALNRELEPGGDAPRGDLARQARDAEADLAVFARVLEATRNNVAVMNRIRALRAGATVEYGGPESGTGRRHGDD